MKPECRLPKPIILEFGGTLYYLKRIEPKHEIKYICCSQLNHSLYCQYRLNFLLLQNKPTDTPSVVFRGVSNFLSTQSFSHRPSVIQQTLVIIFVGFFVLFLVQLWYTCPKVENAKNAAMPEALLLLCNPALPTARIFA